MSAEWDKIQGHAFFYGPSNKKLKKIDNASKIEDTLKEVKESLYKLKDLQGRMRRMLEDVETYAWKTDKKNKK